MQLDTEMKTMQTDKFIIVDKILNDSTFVSILNSYKNKITSAYKIDLYNEYKNGLCDVVYYVTIKDQLQRIILPIFSSEKTTTWNFSYLKDIMKVLPDHLINGLQEHEIIDLIYCPLYFYDKWSGEIAFLSLISAHDFMHHGIKGKNGFSTYFWNDKLPNQYSITKKDLKSDLFVTSLPFYNKKQLKDICIDYATKFHNQFSSNTNRSELTKIKNIANGLYAQIQVYLKLKQEGYNVTMDWQTEDDLGIDIKLHINDIYINIDVKSTKDSNLKITKNRKETDFYAICTWKNSEPVFNGYVFKFDFWKSDILGTLAPEKRDEIFIKPISELNIVQTDELFEVMNKYKIKKIKRNERLFNVQ